MLDPAPARRQGDHGMTYVLWGTPAGETDALHEQPLTERPTAKECELVSKVAARDGWHSFRIVPLGRPEFGANLLRK